MLKVLRELRRALIELVVDDLKHREAHHRVGSWIDTLPLLRNLTTHATYGAAPAPGRNTHLRAFLPSHQAS